MKLPSGAAIEYDHGPGLSNAGSVNGAYDTGQVFDNPSAGQPTQIRRSVAAGGEIFRAP